jgi:hypothetical protein
MRGMEMWMEMEMWMKGTMTGTMVYEGNDGIARVQSSWIQDDCSAERDDA